MKELKIDLKTHAAYETAIKSDPMVKQLRYLHQSFYYCNDVIFSPCFFNFLPNPLFLRKVSLASDEERKITAVDGNPLKIVIPTKEGMNKNVGFKFSSFQLLKQTKL